MPCNPLTDPACIVGGLVGSAARSVASDALSGIAQAVTDGVKWIVTNTATWWLRVPSPNLTGEPAIAAIQHWLLPVTAAVAVGGVIAAGARMALTRRANPLIDVTSGLLTLAAASTIALTSATLLLKAGDAFSTWVLQESTGGHFTQRLILLLNLGTGAAPAAVLIFGLVAIVLSFVQAVLMLFRQAALVILAGVLPLAAAGSIAPLTRAWVRKVSAWMLALICYKPAAAAVYATAFSMIGSARSPRDRADGLRDAAAVAGHAARADAVLHLDHRHHHQLGRWRPAARRAHRRRHRRGRDAHLRRGLSPGPGRLPRLPPWPATARWRRRRPVRQPAARWAAAGWAVTQWAAIRPWWGRPAGQRQSARLHRRARSRPIPPHEPSWPSAPHLGASGTAAGASAAAAAGAQVAADASRLATGAMNEGESQ